MSNKRSFTYYLIKFVADGLLISALFSVVSYWRFGSFSSVPRVVWTFGLLFVITFWLLSFLRRDYMPKIPRDALDSFLSTIFTFLVSYLLAILGTVFFIPSHPSRLVLGLFGVLALPANSICRYCFNRFLSKRLMTEPHKIVFKGAGEAGLEMAKEMEKLYGSQIEIVGFLDDNKNDFEYEILGDLEDLEEIARHYQPDSLFISISNIDESKLLTLLDRARAIGLPVKIVSDVFDIVAQKVTGGSEEKFPVVDIQDTPVRKAQSTVKRTFDLVGAVLISIFFSPLIFTISVLIKLESEGPVLYSQERMKNRSETFTCYKFRTMYKNADARKEELMDQNEKDGPIFKMKDDPRITKMGDFLRRYSLDELPQLINVLRGEMSLIGPRPPTPEEVDEYEEWQKKRLEGYAGMTGLWQVSGRSNLDFKDMCLLDIYYLENWSLWLDFKILLKTIPAVLTGRGAY